MWEQIVANRRRSAVLITLMAIVLLVLGIGAGELMLGHGGGFFGFLLAIGILMIQLIVYFSGAESMLLQGAAASQLKREDCPRLFNIVEEMKLASGLPVTPKVVLINDPAPNAFAYGRTPETYSIAVTSGLLQRLNRDELQGVIAHETGHLKNQDVQFMMLAAVMLGSIAVLAEIIRGWMRMGGRCRTRSESREGGGQLQLILMIVAILLAIFGPLMGQMLYFACSRKREFLADACAAQFTRYPEGLASALEKIAGTRVPLSFVNKANAPMFIINPLAAAGEESTGMFDTHPAMGERVRILRSMVGASWADYEAAYRQAKGGGLIGSGSLQAAPVVSKRGATEEGPILSREEARAAVRRNAGFVQIHCTCGVEVGVPPNFERKEVRCIRCGRVWPVPTAQQPPPLPPLPSLPPIIAPEIAAVRRAAGPPLNYVRKREGWESFRCSCGCSVQLSPTFTGNQVRCLGCGREINITR